MREVRLYAVQEGSKQESNITAVVTAGDVGYSELLT